MAQTISVLLIEDDPDYVALVRAWLAADKEVEFTITWAETLSAGMERIKDDGIDLILLDLSLPDSDGPQTFRVLRTRARQIPIILMSGNDREALALELVSEGAQDYLVKSSCSAKTLSRAILYALVRRPQTTESTKESSARIIGVLSAKGGVGATTLACALAKDLRSQNQGEVLLVDLGLHGNAVSFLLEIKPTYTLSDALSNINRLDENCWKSIVSHAGDLDVLPSPVLQGQEEPEPDQLQQLLYRLALYYSWIVIDLGRLNHRTMALVGLMHQTVVVTSTALSSLYETRRAISTLRAAGCEGDQLLLAVSDLPGSEKLSSATIEEMIGSPVGLRLAESSAELACLGAKEGLSRKDSSYGQSVHRLAQALTGTPAEKPTKRLAQMLGWR